MKSKNRGKLREAFTKEKIVRFLDKQGFYIVLFVCIAIIGVTTYMTSGRNQQPQDIADNNKVVEHIRTPKKDELEQQNEINKDIIDIKVKDSTSQPNEDDETKETLASNNPGKGQETKKDDTATKKETTTKKSSSVKMIYPVQGKITKDHVMDELVYSNTLKEWTTHPGIDIETFVGSEVKAALAGTVEEIIEDPLMGICITLDHGNGLKTFYANLSTANMVTVGQKVDRGQIISGVGRTAGSEILDSPHLHFEVRLNGNSVDPKDYIN